MRGTVRNANPANQEKTKLALPIAFEAVKVSVTDPEANQALIITAPAGASHERISALIKDAIRSKYWQEADYYKQLGQPKEYIQFRLSCGKTVEVYNWLRPLTNTEVRAIENVLTTFAGFAGGDALKATQFIFIDPTVTENPNMARRQRGHSAPMNGVTLFGPALEDLEYEISGVRRLEAVLIHELAHKLAAAIEPQWQLQFQWSAHPPKGWVCAEPHRCITEYAKILPIDDICESVVGLLRAPTTLDPERKNFLDRSFSRSIPEVLSPVIEKILVLHEGITMPEIPQRIYYVEDRPIVAQKRLK